MDFMFEWQEQYLTSERSERVRYCSCHGNIKSISSRSRVMFCLLYGFHVYLHEFCKQRKRREGYVTPKRDIRKIRAPYPGCSGV